MSTVTDLPVRFWICPNPEHRSVVWIEDVAHCTTCGMTSTYLTRWVRGVYRQALADLVGGIARDHPDAAESLRRRARETPYGNPYHDRP